MPNVQKKRFVSHNAEGSLLERSDERLLEEFLSGEGFESEIAFNTVVLRHGPMVLGICRHALGQRVAADEAFQKAFLVLARKAASLPSRRVMAGWLHEVAYRLVSSARVAAVRRRTHESQRSVFRRSIERANPEQETAWNELQLVWDEEVDHLPEKLRIPVILSFMEGKTNEEVSELLHWSVGKVRRRLSRARELIRSRLMRRGMASSAAFLVSAMFRETVFAEIVPAELVNRTVRAAAQFRSRSLAAQSSRFSNDRDFHFSSGELAAEDRL